MDVSQMKFGPTPAPETVLVSVDRGHDVAPVLPERSMTRIEEARHATS